jgi:hypothetical protein
MVYLHFQTFSWFSCLDPTDGAHAGALSQEALSGDITHISRQSKVHIT